MLALWRALLGHDVGPLVRLADGKLSNLLPEAPPRSDQSVFLGRGPGVGIANEAAHKFREAALAWTESYPAMEFRHGPISVIGPRTLVWSLGQLAEDLAEEITATGAELVRGESDPMVELVQVHRAAIELARVRGLDPSQPRRPSRSVVLR
ncbi:MAG: SIS domain-containing protein [Acidimicrobiales bacterium]